MLLKLLIHYAFVHCVDAFDPTIVTVPQGTLQGSVLQTVALNKTYYSFKGIPYAKAPVGNLRFMPPQIPESWGGVRDATEHGSVCPHFDIFQMMYINGSEDCLFLNVYTPNSKPTYLYSVLFFIHGGGFKSGSGNTDFYGPDFFIDNDVLVVTTNYRIDVLGFLSLENELVPGNMGMKDQVAAMKWVKKNIKNFGGDPHKITIMGESAGAASVGLHLISPMSKGLFRRAICMSGAPNTNFATTYKPRLRAFKLGYMLGLDTTNDTELLEFLRAIPTMSLINANVSILGSEVINSNNILNFFNFIPIVEKYFGTEQFLTVDPVTAFVDGNVHDADIMFGTTNEEGLVAVQVFEDLIIDSTARYNELLVPKRILYNSKPDIVMKISKLMRQYYFGNDSISIDNMRKFVTYASETYISVATHRMFSLLPWWYNCRRYSYVLSSFSSRNYYGMAGVPYGIYGTAHLDDLLYLFEANVFNMTIDINSDVYRKVELVSTVFSNFIKYGNPTPQPLGGVIWPTYENTERRYVNIANTTLIIGRNYLQNSINLYKYIFQLANINF